MIIQRAFEERNIIPTIEAQRSCIITNYTKTSLNSKHSEYGLYEVKFEIVSLIVSNCSKLGSS